MKLKDLLIEASISSKAKKYIKELEKIEHEFSRLSASEQRARSNHDVKGAKQSLEAGIQLDTKFKDIVANMMRDNLSMLDTKMQPNRVTKINANVVTDNKNRFEYDEPHMSIWFTKGLAGNRNFKLSEFMKGLRVGAFVFE